MMSISNKAADWLREELIDHCIKKYGDYFFDDLCVIIGIVVSGFKLEDNEYLDSEEFQKHCKILQIQPRYIRAVYNTVKDKQ